MKRKLIEWWKNSGLFRLIDRLVSKHFQKKLKNDNFTILCSNCVGGTIYHRLGKEARSPTINLLLRIPDFVEFCLHLDYYLEQKINFIETNRPYPVGELRGDGADIPTITIYFNHDSVNEEAEAKWERRKVRINRDNMYIMLYNTDGITVEKLRRLEQVKCKNKVVFTPKPIPELDWSYYIKPNMSYKYPFAYLGKDVFGVRHIEKAFDFVGFLNSNLEM